MARASPKKMKKMYVVMMTPASLLQLEMALVDESLPMATPDDFCALVAGHLLHQFCQLLEPGPVNDFPVHAQRIEIHSFAGQVLRLHRLRLALLDILALFLHGTQSLRHIEREEATSSALNHDGL